MAGSAGSIYVDLLLKDAAFVEGTKRAKRALKDFGNTAAASTKIAAGAIAAAGAALSVLAIRQAHVIDETVKMSRALGISNEAFQNIAFVASEAGVEQEKLAQLFVKSQKSIADAAAGSGDAVKAFKQLGLNAKELINLSPDKQFEKIEVALASIENPTLRAALALKIFGRAGIDAVKLSEDFSAKIAEATAFNDKFNISVSSIDARKVEEANDTFARLGRAVGGLGNTIAIELAPIVTALSNALLAAGIDGETMSNTISSGLQTVASFIDTVREAALGLKTVFLDVADAARSINASILEKRVAVLEYFDPADRLDDAKRALEENQKAIAANASEYAALEKEAANFETTSAKIAQIQADAQKRAEEAEAKMKAASNSGTGGVDEATQGRLASLESVTAELDKQTGALQIQNEYYGESQAVIDRQIEQYQILQKLKEDGISLSESEMAGLQSKLDGLQAEKQLNLDLQEAEKERQKAADELLRMQQEEQRMLDESIQKVREGFVDGILDAATATGKFADKMADVAKQIALAVVKAELLKIVTEATGGGSGSSGGGILGSLMGFLPSFDVGTDYVPYDMVAKIHKGERILTASENSAYENGGGVVMNVYTPDADSFRASTRQITRKINSRLAMA